MNIHSGSCHCGAVRFEIAASEPLGPYFRCNCSLCSRKGAVMGAADRSAFRVVEGEDSLSLYQWNTREAEHYFCKKCGIYTHHVMRGRIDTVGVNMACVDGVDVYALSPVEIGNGAGWSVVSQDGQLT